MTTWHVLLDWDRDFDFTDAYDNIVSDVIDFKIRCGMQKPYQHVADEAVCQIRVKNETGKYNPENSSSPLYGKLLPQCMIKIAATVGATTYTLWRGWLDRIEPAWDKQGAQTGKTIAMLYGVGAKQFLQDADLTLPVLAGKRGDEIVDEVLQRVVLPPVTETGWLLGIPGFSELGVTTLLGSKTDYSQVEIGELTFAHYGDVRESAKPSAPNAYKIISEVTEAERGRFFFSREGYAVWWNRSHLLDDWQDDGTLDSTGVSGERPFGLSYAYGKSVCTRVQVTAHQRKEGSSQTLWTLDHTITILPGETIEFEAPYTGENFQQVSAETVSATPTFSSGNAVINVTGKADRAIVNIYNSGSVNAVLTGLTLAGTLLNSNNQVIAIKEDLDARAIYGRRRELKLNLNALESVEDAMEVARIELERRKEARGELLQFTLRNKANGVDNLKQLQWTIGTRLRIKLPEIGHEDSLFILGEEHRVSEGGNLHETTYFCEPCIFSRLAKTLAADADSDVALRQLGSGSGGTTSCADSGSSAIIGKSGGVDYWQAQSFQVAAGNLSEIKFTLVASTGSPSGTITWEVRTNNSGEPSGTVLQSGTHTPTTSSSESYGSANQDTDVKLVYSLDETESCSDSGSQFVLGNSGGVNYYGAQSFTLDTGGVLKELRYYLNANSGTPSGDLTWEIRTDDGTGKPSTTVLQSGTHTPTQNSENTITVSGGITLSASTTYWFVLRPTTTQGTNIYWRWRRSSDAGGTYSNGYCSRYNSTSWTNITGGDCYFLVKTSTAANDKLAQSFTLSAAQTIDKVRLYLKKAGAPSGTLTCRIETDSSGNPSGTLAHANLTATAAESSLSTSYGWIEFNFTDTNLSAGTYWIVLSTSTTPNSTNYPLWGADGSSPSYTGGQMKAYADSTWSAESKDAIFEVITAGGENTVSVSGGVPLSASTTYWLVLKPTSAQSDNTGWNWQSSNTGSGTYASGNKSTYNGTSWTAASTTDFAFSITTSGGTKDKLAQSFTTPAQAYRLKKVRLWLKKVGGPSGNLTVEVQTNSSGNPSGTPITNGTSKVVSAADVLGGYSWIDFAFATPPSLNATTVYWLVLKTTASADADDYIQWGADGSSPSYSGGEMKSESGSVWSAESKDAIFEVYGIV